MGSALALAAIAVAIDHTRHRVPSPAVTQDAAHDAAAGEAPCGLGGGSSPCGPGSSPCGPSNPCSQ